MPIYLVRHGQTKLSGAFCGSSNPPLTRRGRAQGVTAARHLARFSIDACYASPLRRAKQTAALVTSRLKIPLISHSLLKELHFGAWEGLRFQDIEKRWPRLAKRWADDPMTVRIPRAETFTSLRQRIKRFLALIRKTCASSNILVVAHGGSLSAIVLELLGLPDKEFPNQIQPLGSVRMIEGRKMKTIC